MRRPAIAAILVATLLGPALAATNETAVSIALDGTISTSHTNLLGYRQYVKEQADLLVGMAKVLAREIKDGNLQAAQAAYAPAHRYIHRIEPVARALRDLYARMDARADAYAAAEADPNFAGFHRIEYGLFTNQSTVALSDDADRLVVDARVLRDRLSLLDITPTLLVDEAAVMVESIVARRLDGAEEKYSHSDFWDLEANLDGLQAIADALRVSASPDDAKTRAELAAPFAAIDTVLAKQKDGCGFKPYDALGDDDRRVLRTAMTSLAAKFAALRGGPAMD